MLDVAMRQAAVGAAIRRAREEKKWKQRQLAAQIPGRDGPINSQTVSNWERGIHQPDLETLEVIAEALGKPLGYFVGDSVSPGQVDPQDEDRLREILREELAALRADLAADFAGAFEQWQADLEAIVRPRGKTRPGSPRKQ